MTDNELEPCPLCGGDDLVMARFNQKERLILALIFGKIKNDLEKAVDIDKLLNKSCVEHTNTKFLDKMG